MKKRILIIGASGYLGNAIVQRVKNIADYCIIAIGSDATRIPKGNNVEVLSNDEWFRCNSSYVDVVINCAFSRGNDVLNLVSALQFNEQIIHKLKETDIGTIINISSQGIYKNLEKGELSREKSVIYPSDMYSFAKYCQERLFTSNFNSRVTNIRLASLSGNAKFILHFIECVISGSSITVTSPNQYVSLIDIDDAVSGILKVCNLPSTTRKTVYNLGTGLQYSILDLAILINDIGQKIGFMPVQIKVEDKGIVSAAGVDSTLLMEDSDWKPEVSIEKMIERAFAERMV